MAIPNPVPGRFTEAKEKALANLRGTSGNTPEQELATLRSKAQAYDALMNSLVANMMQTPRFKGMMDAMKNEMVAAAQIGRLLSASLRAVVAAMDKSGIPALSKESIDEIITGFNNQPVSTLSPGASASGTF